MRLALYAGLFDGDEGATLPIARRRRAYLHVARGEIAVDGQRLVAGDSAMVTDADNAVLSDGKGAEVLAFDLP